VFQLPKSIIILIKLSIRGGEKAARYYRDAFGMEQQVKELEQATAMTIWLGLKEPMPEFNYNGSEVFCDVRDTDKEVFYWLMPCRACPAIKVL